MRRNSFEYEELLEHSDEEEEDFSRKENFACLFMYFKLFLIEANTAIVFGRLTPLIIGEIGRAHV